MLALSLLLQVPLALPAVLVQVMRAGLSSLITLPEPLPLGVTFRVKTDGAMASKPAVTLCAVFTVTVQVPVPLHAPPQPVKVELPVGVGVSVTTAPAVSLLLQVPLTLLTL